VAAAGILFGGTSVQAQNGNGNGWGHSKVSPADHHDVSLPLRDIVPVMPRYTPDHEKPRPIPGGLVNGLPDGAADPAGQSVANIAVAAATGTSFDGLGVGGGYTPNAAPPDTNGAVGDTQYVQWVNEAFAVYDKTSGALLYGPANGNTIWSGFGGVCETRNDGDPIAQWDKAAHRWVMTQFAVPTGNYTECVAVSQTADATGAWNRYAFSYGAFNDYPKLSVWPDAYYITYNMFSGEKRLQDLRARSHQNAGRLVGHAAVLQYPCLRLDLVRPRQLARATGWVAQLPLALHDQRAPALQVPCRLGRAGELHVHWTDHHPRGGVLVALGGIVQPGTSQRLDSLGDRLMYRLAYRNFGDHEAMVINHSVHASGNKKTEVVGVRWYEIRNPGGAPTVTQQGTYAPTSASRWMGSIAMDKVGNIAMGYSLSSSSIYPTVTFTGRNATDPLGTMGAETIMHNGTGAQGRSLNRWGDYSALTIDPVDQCTFWFTTEYLKQNGTFNWSTRIGNFKFLNCN
jgi:hypothetical protein